MLMDNLPAIFNGDPEGEPAQYVLANIRKVTDVARSLLVPNVLRPICLYIVETSTAFLQITPADFSSQAQRIAQLWDPFLVQNDWVLQWFLVMVFGDIINPNFGFTRFPPTVYPPNPDKVQRLTVLKTSFVNFHRSRLIVLLDAYYVFLVDHNTQDSVPNHFVPKNVAPKALLTGFRNEWRNLNLHATVAPFHIGIGDYPSYNGVSFNSKLVRYELWEYMHHST
ncbi:hypothetical protein ONS95_014333 [Cadophora gregata]|uniref:uncharacterized protein n=1 Tax=Cadophora gregata TaxID=51156 RepID=UPI0026DC4A3C|nr:uncharacterized protein ONS95_014333 [Cadophora gregata]KAK0112589.1 hypothetical protein ONS95_014333 [Cadophora gregata]